MSCRRHGPRKLVTEAKEASLELRRERGKGNSLGGRERGQARCRCASKRGTELGPPSSGLLRVEILGEGPGEDLSKIFLSFPGVSFQGHSLHRLVGTRAGGH